MHDYLVEIQIDDLVLSGVSTQTISYVEISDSAPSFVELVEVGPRGPKGDRGDAGNGFVYHQTSPAATWIVNHNLNKRPDVVLLLDDDPITRVWADLHYIDGNTISIEFPTPVSGWAYI